MSNKMRWRYGDTNPVVASVDVTVEIEIGDLVFLNTDNARPASYQADQGTESANQTLFAGKFLGVAMQQSRLGDMSPIRIATTGVFEYDAAAATFELGDLIGTSENPTGVCLLNQTVKKVATANLAIGRVARRESNASTSVMVDIRSTIMTGGVNGSTAAA